MSKDAIILEETRLHGIDKLEDYQSVHERHRVFPAIFEDRHHKKIIDVAAGVGCTAQRIHEKYPADLVCNDITPKCLAILDQLGLSTVSFPDNHFDTVVSLEVIEHLIHVDYFLTETYRILNWDGYLYISSPNYAGIQYAPQYLLKGRAFEDPLSPKKYEFYAHVRYFTYKTLLEFVSSFGFVLDTVYLPLPAGSTRYQALYASSKVKALAFRYSMMLMYHLFSPRWAPDPILCFRKTKDKVDRKFRRVIL
jgi:2-polyprenyl-3-methyl-5-hydroxy-6-metoxy-1,4-benzoquinol methylase